MKFLYNLIFLFLIITSYSFSNDENGFIWEKYLENDSISRYLLDNHMIKVNDDEYISITPCDIVGNYYLVFTKVDSDGNILREHKHFYYQPQSFLTTFYIKNSYIYNNYLYLITFKSGYVGDYESHFWKFDLNNFEVDKISEDSTFRNSVTEYLFDKDKIIQLGVQNEDVYPHFPIYTEPLIRIFDNDFNIIETIEIDTTGLGFKLNDDKNRGFVISNTILTKDNNFFAYIGSFELNNQNIYKSVPVKISRNGKILWSLFDEVLELDFEVLRAMKTIQLDNGDIVSKFLANVDYDEGMIKIGLDGQIKDFKIFKINSKLIKPRYFMFRDFQYIDELNLYVLPGSQSEVQTRYSQIFYFLDQDFNVVLEFETNVITEPEMSPVINSIYYLGNGMFLIYGSDGKRASPYFAKIRLQPSSISENFNSNSKIRLYPQPSNDYLQIDSEAISDVEGKIYNINGVLIKEVTIINDGLYIGDLVNGIYYLVIDNHKLKFIKF